MHHWVRTLKMITAITPLKAVYIIILITQKKKKHQLSFHVCRVMFTAALHFRTLFLCPRFLQLHGFYWQGWRKHTKTFLSGGLPWLTDPTTHSAGNNFLALLCGLKTMQKNPTKSAAITLVIVSTWMLKTAIPNFMHWSEICNLDILQITWKDAMLCNNLQEQPVRFKQGVSVHRCHKHSATAQPTPALISAYF